MSDDEIQDLSSIDIDTIASLITFIFSAIVLTAIGVIISGKLIANRIPINLSGDDVFSINLIILKLKSTGDEVAWGFIVFILALGVIIFFGGKPASQFFIDQSGLPLTHWSAMCAIAAFISIFVAAAIWIFAPLFRGSPVVSDEEREDMIKKLNVSNQEDLDDGHR